MGASSPLASGEKMKHRYSHLQVVVLRDPGYRPSVGDGPRHRVALTGDAADGAGSGSGSARGSNARARRRTTLALLGVLALFLAALSFAIFPLVLRPHIGT